MHICITGKLAQDYIEYRSDEEREIWSKCIEICPICGNDFGSA